MIVKQGKLFRIVTVEAYNGCMPIIAYMVQRREQRSFLPDKWVNVKGYEDKKKALTLYESLIG